MQPCKCGSTRLDVWVKKNPKWADHGGYYHAGVTCVDCGRQIHDWLEINQVKNISKEKTAHPCQMPFEVMRNIIGWLPRTATIIDPFAGSGTTALAAEAWGMDWRAIEIDADYCDIIAERLETWSANCTSSTTESYNVETAAS